MPAKPFTTAPTVRAGMPAKLSTQRTILALCYYPKYAQSRRHSRCLWLAQMDWPFGTLPHHLHQKQRDQIKHIKPCFWNSNVYSDKHIVIVAEVLWTITTQGALAALFVPNHRLLSCAPSEINSFSMHIRITLPNRSWLACRLNPVHEQKPYLEWYHRCNVNDCVQNM